MTDPKKDLLDPAIIGTTGILKALKANAPTVKRVAITSSFAAIVNPKNNPKTYNEESWNPVTWEEAMGDPGTAYRGSKTFAEKAAWEFIEKEKPNFALSTINPPLVLGPIVSYLNSLDSINTSNATIKDMVTGAYKEKGLPPTRVTLWVDVRDVALAHVKAIEVPEAANKRFFCVAGHMSNGLIAQAIEKNFPDLKSKLPDDLTNDLPEDTYGYDNSRSRKILGLEYRPLDKAVTDTVNSILPML